MLTQLLDQLKQIDLAVALPAAMLALVTLVAGLNFAAEAIKRFSSGQMGNTTSPRSLRQFIVYWLGPATAAIISIAIAIFLMTIALAPYPDYWSRIAAYVLVTFFGGAVGAAELISRFRDDPARAIRTLAGAFYVALNALGSAAALYLIYVFHDSVGFHDLKAADGKTVVESWSVDPLNLVKAILLAGFSSLLFFRTSIFKYHVGDTELAIGPSIVLDTLLNAAERAVDRVMAKPRADFVHGLLSDISFEKAAIILPSHCLALMQNVSNEESQRISSVVNELRANTKMPDKIKSLNLGLALLNVLGTKVLETAVGSLKRELQTDDQVNIDLIKNATAIVRTVAFDPARRMLPQYCYALSPDVKPEVQQKLTLDLTALSMIPDVSDQYKSLILGIRLAQLTGVAALQMAVADLSDSIMVKPSNPAAAAAAAAGTTATVGATRATGAADAAAVSGTGTGTTGATQATGANGVNGPTGPINPVVTGKTTSTAGADDPMRAGNDTGDTKKKQSGTRPIG